MGKNKLESLHTEMCKNAGLSLQMSDSPHCTRATSVTILKAAGLENSRVKSVLTAMQVISLLNLTVQDRPWTSNWTHRQLSFAT